MAWGGEHPLSAELVPQPEEALLSHGLKYAPSWLAAHLCGQPRQYRAKNRWRAARVVGWKLPRSTTWAAVLQLVTASASHSILTEGIL